MSPLFRVFYGKPTKYIGKLLIIQCESANEDADLLDSVRYIVHREASAANKPICTVLLLSLARGIPFAGYQGK